MEFGEVRFGTHKSDKPLVHKITNKSEGEMFCIDAEVIARPPVVSAIPLVAEHHKLIKTRDKVRVYELTLKPKTCVQVSYAFFYLEIILKGSTIDKQIGTDGGSNHIKWQETPKLGDVSWKEPCFNANITNTGDENYVAYICEWR
jgi:hypothetical protein